MRKGGKKGLELGISLLPGQLGSGQLTCPEGTEYSGKFQSGSFAKGMKGFSGIYCENLAKKLTKLWGPS